MTSDAEITTRDGVVLAGYTDRRTTGGIAGRIGRTIWDFARTKPLGAAGAAILLVMVIMAVGADLIVPYDPLAPQPRNQLAAPSLEHPFGTDNLGRDLLSRIIYGARPSLYTGLLVVFVSSALGMVLGITSAYLGGTFDLVVQRLVDGLMAFPGLILAMALLSVFSSGIHIWKIDLPLVWHSIPIMLVMTLIVLYVPSMSRVIRSATFGIMHMPYVEAARAIGVSSPRIILRHLLPNTMAPAIVIASAQLGGVILIEASLSFLGLGLPPPHPSWGSMLQGNGRRFMETAPWLAIFPGLAISLGVLAFNLFGDALRDVLDPRLRGTGRGAAGT
jgi:peptide/nickel transport system permease protein